MTASTGLRAVVVAFAVLSPASLGAQSVETRIAQAAERIEQARADNLDLIAPRLFERAESRLADARKKYDDGAGDDDIDRRVDEALEALDEAEELEPLGRTVLSGALAARIDALDVGAPDYAAEDWEAAEKSARNAGRKIEDDDRAEAEERAARAEAEYREAELNAIRADVLGRTRTARTAALEAKADKLSPVLFGGADSLISACLLYTSDAADDR